MLLLIDNYDSFTHNLARYFIELGVELCIKRHVELSVSDIMSKPPTYIVISPGPGNPDQAGICNDVIREFAGKLPIFGVCLGMQCIAQVFGAAVVHAPSIMHGKTSKVYHNQVGLFQGLAQPMVATRYHSLMVDEETLPDCLRVDAWVAAKLHSPRIIMSLSHVDWPIMGVQFHPESVLTESGHQVLQNFLSLSA